MEAASILGAVAFAILVGYLVPVLCQTRRTLAALETWLVNMDRELPGLMSELRMMSRNMNDLTAQARGGMERAAALLHVAGRVEESVQRVRHIMKGSGGTLIANVASVMAGVRAARRSIRARLTERAKSNGE